MARSNVSIGCAKCFIMFMATIILVQGVVYLGLAIVGLIHRDCTSNVYDATEDPFTFALDMVYFIDEKCGDPVVKFALGNEVQEEKLTIDWASSQMITDRLDIFLYVYIIVSSLWIITSLLIILTLCCRITKFVLAICFWPWLLVVLAGSAMDVVATGFHINDIIQTTSVQDAFNYVGIIAEPNVTESLLSSDGFFVIPSVIMTCLSSRIIVIWILNILGAIFAVVLSIEMSKLNQRRDVDRLSNTSTVTPTNGNQRVTNMAIVASNQKEPDQLRPQQQPQPQQPLQAAQQQPQSNATNEEQRFKQSSAPIVVYASVPASSQRNEDNNRQSQLEPTYESISYRHTDSHPDHLNYPSAAQTPTSTLTPATSTLSPISPLNQRYSSNESPLYASSQSNQPSNRISDELRSQLPWSYTSALNKPQPPRKPQISVYPEIPEPDYAVPEVKNDTQQGSSRF